MQENQAYQVTQGRKERRWRSAVALIVCPSCLVCWVSVTSCCVASSSRVSGVYLDASGAQAWTENRFGLSYILIRPNNNNNNVTWRDCISNLYTSMHVTWLSWWYTGRYGVTRRPWYTWSEWTHRAQGNVSTHFKHFQTYSMLFVFFVGGFSWCEILGWQGKRRDQWRWWWSGSQGRKGEYHFSSNIELVLLRCFYSLFLCFCIFHCTHPHPCVFYFILYLLNSGWSRFLRFPGL